LSTGSAWASSIPNNSSNWNIAYNDKINNAAFTGTTTKTLTITQLDGGTITAPFTDLQGIVAGDTASMLLPYLRRADTTNMLLPYFRDADTSLLNLTNRFNTKLNISDTTLMLSKYLRRADTSLLNLTSRFATKLNISDTALMLLPYFRDADTSLLNLTNRFNTKLNISDTASMLTNYLRSGIASSTYQTKLNGTGFVKASGTNITYDNSSYLRTGLADSTYLKLTGGTLTGALNVNGASTLNFTNVYGKNTYVPFNVGLGEQSIFNVGAYLRGGTVMIFPDSSLAGSSGNLFFANSNVLGVEYSARGSGIRNYIKQGGDVNRNSLALYTSDIGQQNTNRLYINYNGDIGINDDTPSFKLDVNGTLGVTGAAALSSTLSVTEAVTLSTTTATPTSLLGKDGSNVVGTVTTLAQTGLFGRGSVTNAVTDSNGNITVAHGFNFTPIMAFANLPGQTINIVNVKSVDNNNIVFVVRDGPTNDVLNTISVAKIEFFAIK
jgi:hypothetical protein